MGAALKSKKEKQKKKTATRTRGGNVAFSPFFTSNKSLKSGGRLHNTFFFFVFLGPHPWHMEVPRLGVKSELQLPAYTTATVTPDPAASEIYTTACGNTDPYPTEQG